MGKQQNTAGDSLRRRAGHLCVLGGFFVLFSLPHQIPHLTITIRVSLFVQALSIGPENVSFFLQQTTNRIRTHLIFSSLEFSTDLARCFPCPF